MQHNAIIYVYYIYIITYIIYEYIYTYIIYVYVKDIYIHTVQYIYILRILLIILLYVRDCVCCYKQFIPDCRDCLSTLDACLSQKHFWHPLAPERQCAI